jgi:hypothetical protein
MTRGHGPGPGALHSAYRMLSGDSYPARLGVNMHMALLVLSELRGAGRPVTADDYATHAGGD